MVTSLLATVFVYLFNEFVVHPGASSRALVAITSPVHILGLIILVLFPSWGTENLHNFFYLLIFFQFTLLITVPTYLVTKESTTGLLIFGLVLTGIVLFGTLLAVFAPAP